MQRTVLFATALLALAASAADAQVITGTCRSRSLTELADCIARNAPPEPEATEELPDVDAPDAETAAEPPPNALQPTRLGGAIGPSNLRVGPAPAGGPAAGGVVAPPRRNDAPVAETGRIAGPVRGYSPYPGMSARRSSRQPILPTR